MDQAFTSVRSLGEALAAPVRRLPESLRRKLALGIVWTAALAFPWVFQNEGDIDAAANACAFVVLALGLNIVVGFAGLLDLGYAAFFAIGAYSYGAVASWQIMPVWSAFWEPFQWLGLVTRFQASGAPDAVHFTVSFWLMLPISAAISALLGIIFGAPTLRLRGDYLAIVTLGFGEIVPIVARNTPSITNGAMGLNGVQSPSLFGYNFGVSSTPYYYLGLVLIAIVVLVSTRLRDSRIGRAWMAIREDEVAAGAMGVNRTQFKLLAFAIGAGFGGVVGTFYVAKLQTATPEMFMFPVSVMVLVMVVLGGTGSVPGVILGALILQLLQSWFLQDLTQWLHMLGKFTDVVWLQEVDLVPSIELIFGIILVLMMLFRREGLIPAIRRNTTLSHVEQTAAPSRGGIGARLSGLDRKDIRPGTPLLEVRGLSRNFGGITAVKGIDLTVPAHSVFGIIGPNGSGKTTFFNLVTGLDQPNAGTVKLLGKDVTGLASHAILAHGVARTFQNLRLFHNLTVLENVLVGMHSRIDAGPVDAVLRTPAMLRHEKEAREWAVEVLSIFGNRLLPRINHSANSLSYANRRRLEIARAIASRPTLLLLDEPTAGMNPAETLELADQIRSLKDMGMTVLLIEHKLNVINNITDRVAAFDHGEKIAEGTAEEVRRNDEVIRAYLGRKAVHA